jgi:hypothetical protein
LPARASGSPSSPIGWPSGADAELLEHVQDPAVAGRIPFGPQRRGSQLVFRRAAGEPISGSPQEDGSARSQNVRSREPRWTPTASPSRAPTPAWPTLAQIPPTPPVTRRQARTGRAAQLSAVVLDLTPLLIDHALQEVSRSPASLSSGRHALPRHRLPSFRPSAQRDPSLSADWEALQVDHASSRPHPRPDRHLVGEELQTPHSVIVPHPCGRRDDQDPGAGPGV